MTTVQITISDALAKEAEAEGLLETGSIEAILRERLAAARIAKMQVTRQKLSGGSKRGRSSFSPDADSRCAQRPESGSVE